MKGGASIIAPETVLWIDGGVRASLKRCLLVLLRVAAAVKFPILPATSASLEGTYCRGCGRARLPYAAAKPACFFLAVESDLPPLAWCGLGKYIEQILARLAPKSFAFVASVVAATGFEIVLCCG